MSAGREGGSVCLGLKYEKLISKMSLGLNYGESTRTKVIHILDWNCIGILDWTKHQDPISTLIKYVSSKKCIVLLIDSVFEFAGKKH